MVVFLPQILAGVDVKHIARVKSTEIQLLSVEDVS